MQNYFLMNKDHKVAGFRSDKFSGVTVYTLNEIYGKLPYGFKSMDDWLEGRRAAKHRRHIAELMRQYGCHTIEGYIRLLHCTSINDTFWVKREDETLTWRDVSLYSNEFNDVVTKIAFEGAGIPQGRFTSTSPEFSIDGSFKKCCVRENDELFLIKRGARGPEPYCEVFSYPLYREIVKSAVRYELVEYHGVSASKCRLFTDEQTGFVSFAQLSHTRGFQAIHDFYREHDMYDMFCDMLVADAVCFNTDRHGGNHGVLFDNDTLEITGMAPVFDHNLALLPFYVENGPLTIEQYLGTVGPKYGDDWVEVARSVLRDDTRERLERLRGYRIPFEGDEHFPPERVKLLNHLINRQIQRILL